LVRRDNAMKELAQLRQAKKSESHAELKALMHEKALQDEGELVEEKLEAVATSAPEIEKLSKDAAAKR
jgi:hypothetical protein